MTHNKTVDAQKAFEEIVAALKIYRGSDFHPDGVLQNYYDTVRAALSVPSAGEVAKVENALKAARDMARGKTVMGGTMLIKEALATVEGWGK